MSGGCLVSVWKVSGTCWEGGCLKGVWKSKRFRGPKNLEVRYRFLVKKSWSRKMLCQKNVELKNLIVKHFLSQKNLGTTFFWLIKFGSKRCLESRKFSGIMLKKI